MTIFTADMVRCVMSRYIDVDALIDNFAELTVDLWLDSVEEAEIVSLIGNSPSIDIVRCGECEYKRINEDGETRYFYCALEDRPNRQWSVDDTDFCSWGERKTDADG